MHTWLKKVTGTFLNALIIATLLLAGVSVTPALADVILATSWATVATGTNGPYTITDATFSCSAGSNRLLVAVVSGEYGLPGEALTVTAAKGAGVNFTPIVNTSSTARMGVWIGYLTEAQIAGNTDDIVITETASNDNLSGSDVHLACFSGVSQDTPIVPGGTDESNSGAAFTTGPWNFSVEAVNGGMVIYAGGLSNPAGFTTHPTGGYTVVFDKAGGSLSSYRTIVGYKQVTVTGTEADTMSWTNNAHGLAAISLNPAVPPSITSADNTSFTVQVSGTFTVTTTGDPTPSISYTGSLPSGVSLIDNGDGSATLSGTPASGTGGNYPIIITASNGELPNATQNFSLTVTDPGEGGDGGGPSASVLPATGFPKGHVTILPPQPAQKAYTSTDMLLEIPRLNQKTTIVGVPQSAETWDVTWLGNNAGYLAGSAFPTWAGNTVITGHVWDAYNRPGPFENLKALKYGDQIKIHAWGYVYTYEVQESKMVSPKNVKTVMRHEDMDWVTLLSCEFYNPTTGTYYFRRMVRAVLVSVE